MYLAPLDFDRRDAAGTGLPVEWLRKEIEKCAAKFKLLVIDSCHAGSEKDTDAGKSQVAADALGNQFKKLEGVVTLASCSAEQKSQIWDFKQRSLYSYWLTEGLKGHADDDSDGNVDIDELHKYVDIRVTHTADVRFPRAQRPARIIGPRVKGVPTVVKLTPQPLRKVLANMAEHTATLIDEHRLRKVGVFEFADSSGMQSVLGGQFGLLGKFCGDELERQLSTISQHANFRVADRNQLRNAMRNQGGFSLKDISSPTHRGQLSKSVGKMQVLALGAIRNRNGPIIQLQCELKEISTGDRLGMTGGTAVLSEADYAMLGRSVSVRPEDRRSEIFVSSQRPEAERPETERVIERIDRRAQNGHLLDDPFFRQNYDVRIKVNGKVQPLVKRGNDCYVGMRKGDTYVIDIENKSGQLVIVRTLVDGLDTTLKMPDKGLATDLWAQPVTHLDEAGIQYLDPKDEQIKGRPPVWQIQGFTTKTGVKGKLRLFEVVDAADSLAARQGFTEQIGLITVAFFATDGSKKGLGTAPGEERDREIRTRKGPRAGNLIGVVHIRYVDADAL